MSVVLKKQLSYLGGEGSGRSALIGWQRWGPLAQNGRAVVLESSASGEWRRRLCGPQQRLGPSAFHEAAPASPSFRRSCGTALIRDQAFTVEHAPLIVATRAMRRSDDMHVTLRLRAARGFVFRTHKNRGISNAYTDVEGRPGMRNLAKAGEPPLQKYTAKKMDERSTGPEGVAVMRVMLLAAERRKPTHPP
ncbi:hypothetical protein PMIN01_07425 [Paraphaeosphaeria minitans]|uniref:Uncharacterized protein n=1 Tax=Paraphaeosphaeria minitans TaxID=565426 RepID=A0A9P6GEY3_9PLEO|nr:hypothetical protein PMIN01_07425 [Paraphaeosphaeria minitans]